MDRSPFTESGKGMWEARRIVFESLPSTNQWALEHLSELNHGDVVRAIRQTGGRGRFDRSWSSPGSGNLTFTVILRPDPANEAILPFISLLAALSVSETIARNKLPAMLKWPNDVLVHGRKISGILAERDPSSGKTALGIGINVNLSAVDLALLSPAKPATSMAMETGREIDVDDVAETALMDLESHLDRLFACGSEWLLNIWRLRDALSGAIVEVSGTSGIIRGKYQGIDAMGRLYIVDASGFPRTFWSGDVTLSAIKQLG